MVKPLSILTFCLPLPNRNHNCNEKYSSKHMSLYLTPILTLLFEILQVLLFHAKYYENMLMSKSFTRDIIIELIPLSFDSK